MSPDRPSPQDFPDARAVLSANLVRLRRERGWSQEKLAFESGLDRSFIAHVERQARNISLDSITRLARTLAYRFTCSSPRRTDL